MDTTIIWNERAGSAESARAARDELRGETGLEIVEVGTRRETIHAARQAAQAGTRLVVAAGGDGTVNAVVNGLMACPQRPVMGVLPIGTANDFARTLAMPLEAIEAARLLRQEEKSVRPLDVIESKSGNGSESTSGKESHYFINMATAGNSERVIEHMTEEQKDWWGPLCYVRGAIDVALDLESYAVELQLDDQPPRTFTAWNLILANGRTSAAGLPIASRANPEDGLLDVILVTDGTLPELVEIGARLWMDRLLESDLVEWHRARAVRVSSDPPLYFSADGDLIEWVPAEFHVLAGALRVVVGPQYMADSHAAAPAGQVK